MICGGRRNPCLPSVRCFWLRRRSKRANKPVRCIWMPRSRKRATKLLRDWLDKLKDVLYDADDVSHEFQIETWWRELQSITKKVCKFFSRSNKLAFGFKMGRKIRKLGERFDEITKGITQFSLTTEIVERDVFLGRETFTSVLASDVIGRDRDRENIVRLLMHKSDGEQLTVIPIIGRGGLGKTTLAKLVYNDKRIVDQFDLRMWVCTSEEFDLRRMIRRILDSADIDIDSISQELEDLQQCLRDLLYDRKYILILDNVRIEDTSKWIQLENLLKSGAPGSKILVTSRSDSVATIVAKNGTSRYSLKGLSSEDCLSLLWKSAFRTKQDVDVHPDLVEIGREIVEKCKGVPLSIRTLGNLLYKEYDNQKWIYVRDNEIWKLGQKEGDILPALKLSYDNLPPNLKQCFAFCSIFPKDFEFSSSQLTSMWSAQGLLGSLDKNQDVEDTGAKYIKQLGSRGFFQEFEEMGSLLQFKMHDLVHDLAVLVGKPECLTITSHDAQWSDLTRVQYLSFFDCSCFEGDEFPSWLLEMKHLRTILFPIQGVVPTGNFLETCISRFNCLHLLDLSDSTIEVLPSSISRLIHLRFLNLSGNVKIKSLPNSICKLGALETLLLTGCVGLERLPKGLGKLMRLTYLSITTKEKCLPEKEIRCLTSLQLLVISDCPNMEFLLSNEGMRSLYKLRTLSIFNCRGLVSLPASGLRSLTTLENLVIGECETLDLNFDDRLCHGQAQGEIAAEEGIGFQGRGLSNLQLIVIGGMPKLVALPLWILCGANTTLQHLLISDCQNLTELMAERLLEKLKALRKLHIEDCPQLMSLPENIRGLATLKEIRIQNCPLLIKRCQRETGEDWEKIACVPNIYLDEVRI